MNAARILFTAVDVPRNHSAHDRRGCGCMYREIRPPSHLAGLVECFWVSEPKRDGSRRVLPDGCLDILFISRGRDFVGAQVVGAMTRFSDVPLRNGESLLGIRFHPGMAGVCLPGDLPALNDRLAPIEDVMGSAAKPLLEAFRRLAETEDRVAQLSERLVCSPRISEVQQAIGSLTQQRGQLSVVDLAEVAGLGDRQFRRACYKHSGLAPKQLARILRFRHAVSRLKAASRDGASLALDCGYYDQAHMIRDFRELAGTSPTALVRENDF
jgi:AraC-like DNA-binding protein